MKLTLNNFSVLHGENPEGDGVMYAEQSTTKSPAATSLSAANGIDLHAVDKYIVGSAGGFHMKGMDAMQNVPAGSHGRLPSGGSDGPSAECNDGILANIGKAVGSSVTTDVVGEQEIGGAAGQHIGASMCEAGKAIASTFDTGPDSDSFSYDDPETGERITNDRTSTGDWSTTAGDPNAPKGEYIGEADDPNFVNAAPADDSNKNQSTNTDNNNSNQSSTNSTDSSSSQSTQQSSDNNSTQQSTDNSNQTQQSSQPVGPNPGSGNLPADDTSGSTGPAGPRANVYQSMSNPANFMPSDDSTGNPGPGGPRSNGSDSMMAASTAAQNGLLAAGMMRGIIIIGG
jgi:hypothetical protein